MNQNEEKGITLVALVITIIILIILAGISINTLIGENGIITKAKEAKQNITLAGEAEAIQLNQLYYELENGGELTEDDNSKDEIIRSLREELEKLYELLEQTNATEDKILKDYKAYSQGQLLTGTMIDRGAVGSSLNCGQSYIIPEGYHNGSGVVTANSLASQTSATATANNLSSGVTAWVNGVKITGNGTDVNNSYNEGYAAGQNSSTLTYITVTFPVSTSWVTSKSVSITELYSQYASLTIDNMIPVFDNYPSIRNSDAVNAFRVSYSFSYNSSTGTFTVSCNTEMRTYSTFSMKLYIIK